VRAVIRLINEELFKLRKRLMTRVLLFVLIGIIIILYFLLLAVTNVTIPAHAAQNVEQEIQNLLGLPVSVPFALSLLASFGSVLSVILLASSMGNEYNWRTIRTIVISSESRFKLLGAKLISAGILIFIGMLIGVVAGFVMSLITTAIGGFTFNFDFLTGSYAWDQFLQFWRTYYVLLPYVLLGFLFSIVGRSAMPGIALGIGIFFLESIITAFMVLAGGWIANIPDYLLYFNVRAITSMSSLPSQLGSGFAFGNGNIQLPTPTHAFITLGIYSVVFLVIAFYLFRKRDVTT
jgi:ABC-2 type transport system permease protein